jgi:hypothetical protein
MVVFGSFVRWMLLGAAFHFGGAPDVPQDLLPPRGETLLLEVRGKGNQIYVCQKNSEVYAWKLKGPDAKLFTENGELAGKHFAGPTWEAKDGSWIKGKLAASQPAPDSGSVPWLLLTIVSRGGTGIMEGVQSIQRLDTKGGMAPAGGCSALNENGELAVPYEASYNFYGSTAAGKGRN